jgi:hypothetical protein
MLSNTFGTRSLPVRIDMSKKSRRGGRSVPLSLSRIRSHYIVDDGENTIFLWEEQLQFKKHAEKKHFNIVLIFTRDGQCW